MLVLQGLCSLLRKQSSFLGIEKLVSSSVGTERYVSCILNVPFIVKWQHGICVRRNKFDFHTFVFFQVLQQSLQWLEVRGRFTGCVSHPLEISSLLHGSNSFFETFLYSQASVLQLNFKTREGYWNKIVCSGKYNICGEMFNHHWRQNKCWQVLLPQLLRLLCTHCTTPAPRLKSVLPPQGTLQIVYCSAASVLLAA